MDLNYIVEFFGTSALFYFIFLGLKAVYRIIRKPKNLIERYGQGWAVITGATDGLGKGFCIELAKQGFNICVGGRNPEKIKSVIQELNKNFPKIKTSQLLYDLKNAGEDQDFEKTILKQLEPFINDISLLVNNAGIDSNSPFHLQSQEFIKTIVSVNATAPTLLLRALYEKFNERYDKKKLRTGVINVASFAGETAYPYQTIYSGTKSYLNLFTRSLAMENQKIDIMVLNPGFVCTKLVDYRKGDGSLSPEVAAKGALDMLGYETSTNGHILHRIQAIACMTIPTKLLQFFAGLELQRMYKAKLKKQ